MPSEAWFPISSFSSCRVLHLAISIFPILLWGVKFTAAMLSCNSFTFLSFSSTKFYVQMKTLVRNTWLNHHQCKYPLCLYALYLNHILKLGSFFTLFHLKLMVPFHFVTSKVVKCLHKFFNEQRMELQLWNKQSIVHNRGRQVNSSLSISLRR